MSLRSRIIAMLRRPRRTQSKSAVRTREPLNHVVIIDGTMTSLERGLETNAGHSYLMLCEIAESGRMSLMYERGVQWRGWRYALDVIEGRGINRQIRRAYGFIASRYRPGDKIYLIGYSRGAYAVRSLAGVIDRVGLLKTKYATERHIRDAYRHYQVNSNSRAAEVFSRRYCHQNVEIEAIGAWDTVKALGSRIPILWNLSPDNHLFHSHTLGPHIKAGFHALARDETRQAYVPVLWKSSETWNGILEQVWFRGTHGDVGGHLGGYEPARPLANVSLVWMLGKLEGVGLPMPKGWQERFPQDPTAPSVGSLRGWGKMLVIRRRRKMLEDASESIHPTAEANPKRRIRA